LISDTLGREIRAGTVEAGGRLPADAVLAARFGVNRHTIRRAYEHLEHEGLVRVEHGRGRFVADSLIAIPLGIRGRFEDNLQAMGLEASRTITAVVDVPATLALAQELGVAEDAALVRVTAVVNGDGVPFQLCNHYFSRERLPRIGAAFRTLVDQPSGSISYRDLLRAEGVAEFERSHVRIGTRPPLAHESRTLRMSRNDHVLEVDVLNVDPLGATVFFGRLSYCGSRVKLALEL
jgi:GntR family transcriptional regulator, phosphonate transport system regulatory protein